ncbi:MAG: signal peptidase I, partial [Clostridiales bacterium]|nr:signal peptidase I [Clostridiales bacterium]
MKVLKTLGQVVLFVILIFFILLNILSMNNKSLFGFRIYRVISGSMQPALQIGDVIIIKKANNYAEKDIITYDNGLTTITHRIKSINGDEIITEGDANDAPDKPITKDRILGKYFFRISTFSVFSIMLTGKTIYLIMVLVLFAILLFAISDRVTRNLEYRRNNFKKVIKEKDNKEQKKKMPKKKDEMEILAEKLHKETLKMHK